MKKAYLTLKVLFFSCLLFAGTSLFAQSTFVTFNGGGITQAASSGVGTPYPSTIAVSGVGSGFLSLTVTLENLSHTWPDDINFVLVSPSGGVCVLMSDAGGSTDIVNATYTFQDGAMPMLDFSLNASGTYAPTNFENNDNWPAPGPGTVNQTTPTLSSLGGANADGTWSLYYHDDAAGDSGSLGSWSITFEIPPAPDNDNCVDAETLACGETVSGTNIDAQADNVRRCGSGTPSGGVWYVLDDVDDGGFIQSLSTCDAANFQTRISVYYGDCNRLRCLGSSDDPGSCSNGTAEMFFTPFFGKTHYVLVQGAAPGLQGVFELTYNCDAGLSRPQGVNVVTAADLEGISLYPNPVQGVLNVTLEGFTGRQVSMRIHNSVGQVVMQRNISRLEEQVERFNTSQLQSGMYFLNVQVEGGESFTEKFMVGNARP